MMKLYSNGSFSSEGNPKELLEPGFLFGWGVFETIRVYQRKPAFLSEHVQRLEKSCRKLFLEFPDCCIPSILEKLLDENQLDDAYCRVTVYKRREGAGILIHVAPFAYYQSGESDQGVSAVIAPFRRYSANPFLGLKLISYCENRIAWRIAQDKKAEEALMLNENDFLTGGSRSSIFFVKDGVLCTPSLACGVFPGITRERVLAISKRIGLFCKEGEFKPEDLTKAQEVFLTSSLMEIMPLVYIQGCAFTAKNPGIWTKKLHSLYLEEINNAHAV